MESTNYQRALLIIHELEKRFGSITKVPESNYKMREIHRLLPMDRPTKDVNYRRIRLLYRQGYSIAYIARMTHHSETTISKHFSIYNLKPKQAFEYRIKSNSSTVAYHGTSLKHLASLLLHKNFSNTVTANRQLNMHGFSVRTHHFVWYRIPDGDYYTLNYLDHFAVKNGLDSYIYPDA